MALQQQLLGSVGQRIARNWTIIFGGGVAAAVFNLLALTIAARALGPDGLGVLVLIYTYTLAIDGLLNFQSWQTLIKLGVDALHGGLSDRLARLLKFGFLLDGATALLGFAVAVAAVPLFVDWVGLAPETTLLAQVFCLMILFNVKGTPTAIVRIFDRFVFAAYAQSAAAVLRLVAAAVAWFLSAGLASFLLIWLVTEVLKTLLLLLASLFVLHRNGLLKASLRASGRQAVVDSPQIWSFVWTTNASSALRLTTQDFDTLIVGGLLGTAPAGIYQLAKRYAWVVHRLGEPLQQAVYPELVRLRAANDVDEFRRTVWRSNALAGAVSTAVLLGAALLGQQILVLMAGPEFADAYPILLVLLAAYTIFLFGVTFRPALLSFERQRDILVTYVGATVLFYGTLFSLLEFYGALGVAVSHIVFNLFWYVRMTWCLHAQLRLARTSPPAESAAGAQG